MLTHALVMTFDRPLRGAKFSVFEGGVRVPAFVNSPLLPASARGKTTDALIYIADWYVTLALLAGVTTADLNTSGPVHPDGLDVWSAVTGAGSTPQAPSPRTMIVHDYDDKQGVYAFRSGEWKVIWGKVGVSDWIEDVSYPSGCTALLPPRPPTPLLLYTPSAEASVDAVGIADASEPTENLDGEETTHADDISCTIDSKCLFNVVNDPNERNDPIATAKANPDVMAMLEKQLEQYVADRYTGTLDEATTSEADYCAFIKKTMWVQPYDDDAPPAPAALLNGAGVQNAE